MFTVKLSEREASSFRLSFVMVWVLASKSSVSVRFVFSRLCKLNSAMLPLTVAFVASWVWLSSRFSNSEIFAVIFADYKVSSVFFNPAASTSALSFRARASASDFSYSSMARSVENCELASVSWPFKFSARLFAFSAKF